MKGLGEYDWMQARDDAFGTYFYDQNFAVLDENRVSVSLKTVFTDMGRQERLSYMEISPLEKTRLAEVLAYEINIFVMEFKQRMFTHPEFAGYDKDGHILYHMSNNFYPIERGSLLEEILDKAMQSRSMRGSAAQKMN